MDIGGVLETFMRHDKTRNQVCSSAPPHVSSKDSTNSKNERRRNSIPVSKFAERLGERLVTPSRVETKECLGSNLPSNLNRPARVPPPEGGQSSMGASFQHDGETPLRRNPTSHLLGVASLAPPPTTKISHVVFDEYTEIHGMDLSKKSLENINALEILMKPPINLIPSIQFKNDIANCAQVRSDDTEEPVRVIQPGCVRKRLEVLERVESQATPTESSNINLYITPGGCGSSRTMLANMQHFRRHVLETHAHVEAECCHLVSVPSSDSMAPISCTALYAPMYRQVLSSALESRNSSSSAIKCPLVRTHSSASSSAEIDDELSRCDTPYTRRSSLSSLGSQGSSISYTASPTLQKIVLETPPQLEFYRNARPHSSAACRETVLIGAGPFQRHTHAGVVTPAGPSHPESAIHNLQIISPSAESASCSTALQPPSCSGARASAMPEPAPSLLRVDSSVAAHTEHAPHRLAAQRPQPPCSDPTPPASSFSSSSSIPPCRAKRVEDLQAYVGQVREDLNQKIDSLTKSGRRVPASKRFLTYDGVNSCNRTQLLQPLCSDPSEGIEGKGIEGKGEMHVVRDGEGGKSVFIKEGVVSTTYTTLSYVGICHHTSVDVASVEAQGNSNLKTVQVASISFLPLKVARSSCRPPPRPPQRASSGVSNVGAVASSASAYGGGPSASKTPAASPHALAVRGGSARSVPQVVWRSSRASSQGDRSTSKSRDASSTSRDASSTRLHTTCNILPSQPLEGGVSRSDGGGPRDERASASKSASVRELPSRLAPQSVTPPPPERDTPSIQSEPRSSGYLAKVRCKPQYSTEVCGKLLSSQIVFM